MKGIGKAVTILGLSLVLFLSIGCGKKADPPKGEASEVVEEVEHTRKKSVPFYHNRIMPDYLERIKGSEKFQNITDYSKEEHWMLLPKNPSKEVDTIYLYPTVYGTISSTQDQIAEIDDVSMHIMALYSAANQASVFEESSNVYAPYYRQFTVEALLDLIENCPEALSYVASREFYPMLDYYFEHLNQGRPFILAGHSQGSVWLTIILQEYMKAHPEYLENMVAAYAIGFSVTKEDLKENPHLKFATGERDTGVIVSWNTEGKKNVEENARNRALLPNAISINPLNWKLDETYAPASKNLGSFMLNEKAARYEITNIGADAQVNLARGVIVTNAKAAPIALTDFFGPQSFHDDDYTFYYNNIKDNVAKRIAAYKANH